MKRLTAQRPILYGGRMYQAGDTLPAYDKRMVQAWLSAESAKMTDDAVEEATMPPQDADGGQDGTENADTTQDTQEAADAAEGAHESQENHNGNHSGDNTDMVEGVISIPLQVVAYGIIMLIMYFIDNKSGYTRFLE